MTRISYDAVVLGAGLTGACAALELAREGLSVALVERDERAVNRASLRNEGKLHLGFVFSQDLSERSFRLQLRGALRFRKLLAPLLGPETVASLVPSHPFVYLVPHDSIADPNELERRFIRIEAAYREEIDGDPSLDYAGRRPARLARCVPPARYAGFVRPERFSGAFETEEIAIDTEQLARHVRGAIAVQPRIAFLSDRTVTAVERDGSGFAVHGTSGRGSWSVAARSVVNALWENRFKIDRTVGLEHAPGWLHRLKYRVIARLPDALRDGPSTTLVVGPYGDVVVRPDGTAYFSWYPLGLRGWSEELTPPPAWDRPCRGELSPNERRDVAAKMLGAIDQWYPGAARATPLQVDAGAIVAYGRSDVGDPASGLHDRTHVGVTSDDGYHGVDPGKLTTAPLFGVAAARAVLADLVPAP